MVGSSLKYTVLQAATGVYVVIAACKKTGKVQIYEVNLDNALITPMSNETKLGQLKMWYPRPFNALHPWIRAKLRADMQGQADGDAGFKHCTIFTIPPYVTLGFRSAPVTR